MEFKNIEPVLLKSKTQEFVRRRPQFCNYYMADLTDTSCCELENTLVIKKSYEGYNRIYFLSTDGNELSKVLSSLTENDAINIPTKNGISDALLEILNASGYKLFAKYERLYRVTNDADSEYEDWFAKEDDVEGIYNLLLESFNKVSDRLPSRREISEMVQNKQVFVLRDDYNSVLGVIIFTIDGKICKFLEWASKGQPGKSLFLFLNTFSYMKSLGIERSTIWVRSDNIRPKKIYLAWGYKNDGLYDYTFIKPKPE